MAGGDEEREGGGETSARRPGSLTRSRSPRFARVALVRKLSSRPRAQGSTPLPLPAMAAAEHQAAQSGGRRYFSRAKQQPPPPHRHVCCNSTADRSRPVHLAFRACERGRWYCSCGRRFSARRLLGDTPRPRTDTRVEQHADANDQESGGLHPCATADEWRAGAWECARACVRAARWNVRRNRTA